MAKYLLVAVIVVVGVLLAYLLWPAPEASICADEVRGYERSVESALTGAAKNLQEVEVKLGGSESRKYIEELSTLEPSDLLSLKACDTQCRLLERCLNLSKIASIEEACPTEYRDYQARVEQTLTLMAKADKIMTASATALEEAGALKQVQAQLKLAEEGVGATGAREVILRQKVASQKSLLDSAFLEIQGLTKDISVERN